MKLKPQIKFIKYLGVGMAGLVILSACAPAIVRETIESASVDTPNAHVVKSTEALPISGADMIQSTTQNNLTGNHIVSGSIDLQNAASLDIPLAGVPLWLVSAPYNTGVVFVAVMDNGAAQAFKIVGQTYETVAMSTSQLPAGTPPLLVISDGNVQLVAPPADASPLTTPILIDDQLTYIASNGDLVLKSQSAQCRLPINALPDSRILVDDQNRLLVLTQPTTRYAHGVLGDAIEASGITLLETQPELRVLKTISIAAPDVIEGLSAIWADVDHDGNKDIIITLSNDQTGARITAFREDGSLLAESDPVGRGFRWRHQLAFAPFAADQSSLLVSIRTPHIGGIVEFIQYKNGKLEIVKEIPGYSTHSIGSRDLDAGLAGDFNNDGLIELLAPDQSHTGLALISINGVVTAIPLNGELTSNLSAASNNGSLYLGVGTRNNLRVWVP